MSRAKMLLVEDDAALAELLVYHFKREDFDVVQTPDGEEALLLAQETPPDIVLLDIGLPGMPGKDGFDILGYIRRKEAWSKVPVVMVTAEVSDDQVMRGLRAGADGYMFKPFKWEALYSCIKEVVGI